MIDKNLVKKRFQKSFSTYDDNAIIQKSMAKKLVSLLPVNTYKSVLEIGTATGVLTKEIKKKILFEEFYANDIVEDSRKYVDKIIPSSKFICGDIEEIELPKKFDLIISNASLQWCNNFDKTIEKLKLKLNPDGILAISIFGQSNLKEIKDIFKIQNTIYEHQNPMLEEEINLEFNNLVEVLKHIKKTGVNAVELMTLTKTKLKNYEDEYRKKYSNGSLLKLTYNPVYIVVKL